MHFFVNRFHVFFSFLHNKCGMLASGGRIGYNKDMNPIHSGGIYEQNYL